LIHFYKRLKLIKMLIVYTVFSIISLYTLSLASNFTENARLPKQGLFNVVNFPNEPCRGSNGYNGTCLSGSECAGNGGRAVGSCAQGFGTCCYYELNTCGGSITYNQTYIRSPDFPEYYKYTTDTSCTYTISRINNDVCMLRFDLETFELGGPYWPSTSKYQCSSTDTDYVSFTPAGNRQNGVHICGYNPGQHVYIDMGSPAADPATASMTMLFDSDNQADINRKFNIMVSQIECNTNYAPPQGCDQYFYGNGGSGVIQSLNFDQPSATYVATLAGHLTVCIRREADMCVIGYTPPDVDNDPLGFSISNGLTFVKGRRGCYNPHPAGCAEDYIRIPQGTTTLGNAPFVDPAGSGCDRFCGKRLCGTTLKCTDSDHDTVYSRILPFQMFLEFSAFGPIPGRNLKGFRLNYFQLKC